MVSRIVDLCRKEVVSVKDGGRLGYVCDVEIDCETAAVTALVVYGRGRLFGLLGRESDAVIPWEDVEMLGGDIVLVKCASPERKESWWERFWKKLMER